eukprot:scaffold1350_cov56-Cyclotella_meneghiniana.AAC.23
MKRSHCDADLSPSIEDTDLTYPWLDCEKPSYGFTAATKDALLSSSTVDAKYVLRFTLDFVFGWYHNHCLLPYCDLFHSNKNTIIDYRVTLLEFVTEWLAAEEEGRNNNVPSLKTLCAQRIAMEIFQKFVSNIDHHFENSDPSFFNIALFNYIELESANKIGVPVHIHSFVVEEVCIFVIVYLLYIEVRKQTFEPSRRRDLQIPTPHRRDPHGFWWDHIGIRLVDAIVKIRAGDNHLNIQHPMAESVALIPIISTLEACFIRFVDDQSESLYHLFEDSVIPWLNNIQIEPIHKEPDLLHDSMIRVSSLTGSSRTDVHTLEPLMAGKSRGSELVQNCIDMVDTLDEYGRPPLKNYPCSIDRFVKRIRLTGNFSKLEILRTAIRMNGNGPAILDFEDCKTQGNPKVLNREEKLERENRRLLQENTSLKRQIDELKSRCGLI